MNNQQDMWHMNTQTKGEHPTWSMTQTSQAQMDDWEVEAKPYKHNRAPKPTPSNSINTSTWADATKVFYQGTTCTKKVSPYALDARRKEIHQQRLYHWVIFQVLLSCLLDTSYGSNLTIYVTRNTLVEIDSWQTY